MANSPEKIASTAVQQIRPPPLLQRLREFASRPDTWVRVARNMIPVVGIYFFFLFFYLLRIGMGASMT